MDIVLLSLAQGNKEVVHKNNILSDGNDNGKCLYNISEIDETLKHSKDFAL